MYILSKIKVWIGGKSMQDEVRDCSCCNNCNQGGLFGNLFGGCNNDSTILFFIIIFLLLFTNFGCGCGR